MIEFIVIGESEADARTATKLAERVLKEKLTEKFDWFDVDDLQYYFQWSGLIEGTKYSSWKDIKNNIPEELKSLGYKIPRYRGHPGHKDGANAIKTLNIVSVLQQKRNIRAVIFIRDTDTQQQREERTNALEKIRLEYLKDNEEPSSENENVKQKLEIIIGLAVPKREAWVLNGFIASDDEKVILEDIKNKLSFDPSIEPERLRSTSEKDTERIRNIKFVVEQLTGKDMEREKQCWEETSLEILRARGVNTGLTAYLQEVEERLSVIILSE